MAEALFYIGVLQLTVVFLSIAAGVISMSLWKSSNNKILQSWKWLVAALILFAIVEVIGVLDAFDVFRELAWLRFILPSIIMMCLIIGVVKQIYITRGEK